jgi:hypothetical protein
VPILLVSDSRSPRKPFREAATDSPPALRIDNPAIQGQARPRDKLISDIADAVTAISKLSK